MAKLPKPLEQPSVKAEVVEEVVVQPEAPAVKLVKVRTTNRDMRDPFQNRWFSEIPQETPLTGWVKAQIDAGLLKVV